MKTLFAQEIFDQLHNLGFPKSQFNLSLIYDKERQANFI